MSIIGGNGSPAAESLRPGPLRRSKAGTAMIDFEEEIAKFRPSTEVDQTEDIILHTPLKDMTDLMLEILKEKES